MFKQLAYAALAAVASAQSLTDALKGNADLSQLTALVAADPALLAALGAATNITILAPNNNALSALTNSSAGQAFAARPGAIGALLTYHVLNGTYYSAGLPEKAFVPSLLTNSSWTNVTGGQVVEVLKSGSGVSLSTGLLHTSNVVKADQNYTGGTIHVINTVLTIPENINNTLIDSSLTAAWAALNLTGVLSLAESLRDATFFVPSNKAFESISNIYSNSTPEDLAKLLSYHAVSTEGQGPLYSSKITGNATIKTHDGQDLHIQVRNGSVFVNNAKVIQPDLLIAGGVIHVIDQVLNPANSTATAPGDSGVIAFPSATSSSLSLTSAVPTPAQTTGGGAAAATSSSSKTSSSSGAAAAPMQTAGVGAALMLGAAALLI